jgi:hypothetical protein
MGINLWNNDVYRQHSLDDLFIGNLSVTENIMYNPFYKKGIICGIGLMEDDTYIYSQGSDLRLYGLVQLGLKF